MAKNRGVVFGLAHVVLGFVLTVLTIIGIIVSIVFSGFITGARTVVSGVVVVAGGSARVAGSIISTSSHAAKVAIVHIGSALASATVVVFNIVRMLITRAAAALATLLKYFQSIAGILVPKIVQMTTYILREIGAFAIPLVQKILTAAAYLMYYILQALVWLMTAPPIPI